MRKILGVWMCLVPLSLLSDQLVAGQVTVTLKLAPITILNPSQGLDIRCPEFRATVFDGTASGSIRIVPLWVEVLALPLLGNPNFTAGVRFTGDIGGQSLNLSTGGTCSTEADGNAFLIFTSEDGFSCQPERLENVPIPNQGAFSVNFDCRLPAIVDPTAVLPIIIPFLLQQD